MAITNADCVMWRALRDADAVQDRPTVLEIGKANWYGDVPAEQFWADLRKYGPPVEKPPPGGLDVWEAAAWYYRAMLRNPTLTAIDLDPEAPGGVLRHDLNWPIPDRLVGRFDVVVNTGTAEHVFDLCQVWRNVHDACKPGGIMAHGVPLWGWLDHGFVNYQPTFVADLAAANGYEILVWLFSELKPPFVAPVASPADVHALAPRARDRGAMMHFAYRRTTAAPFAVPMQGVYSERATGDDMRAWLGRR